MSYRPMGSKRFRALQGIEYAFLELSSYFDVLLRQIHCGNRPCADFFGPRLGLSIWWRRLFTNFISSLPSWPRTALDRVPRHPATPVQPPHGDGRSSCRHLQTPGRLCQTKVIQKL
jgi:hypothetical protein